MKKSTKDKVNFYDFLEENIDLKKEKFASLPVNPEYRELTKSNTKSASMSKYANAFEYIKEENDLEKYASILDQAENFLSEDMKRNLRSLAMVKSANILNLKTGYIANNLIENKKVKQASTTGGPEFTKEHFKRLSDIASARGQGQTRTLFSLGAQYLTDPSRMAAFTMGMGSLYVLNKLDRLRKHESEKLRLEEAFDKINQKKEEYYH